MKIESKERRFAQIFLVIHLLCAFLSFWISSFYYGSFDKFLHDLIKGPSPDGVAELFWILEITGGILYILLFLTFVIAFASYLVKRYQTSIMLFVIGIIPVLFCHGCLNEVTSIH